MKRIKSESQKTIWNLTFEEYEKQPSFCKRCKKKFLFRRRLASFCSKECRYRLATHEMSKDGTRRIFMLNKHGNVCFVCKLTKWNGQAIPTELYHIDGNSDNNIESNLRLICPNCHPQTPTHAGKNAKNFRGTKRHKKYVRLYIKAETGPVTGMAS